MAVIQGIIFKAYPGKMPAMMARMAKSKAILSKHGINARIIANVVGAAAPGSVMFSAEYENMADYGKKMDAASADPEFQKLQAEMAEAPNGEMINSSIWQEVDL